MKSLPLFLFLIFGVVGCEHGHCHRLRNRPEEKVIAPESSSAILRTVKIFKYDGSLQCGQGSAVGLEDMAKELKQIKVYSSIKKNDGLMHIQVCGSPTGQANVFEISELDLPVAEKLGFKKWSFE